jgi:hypothetical protein
MNEIITEQAKILILELTESGMPTLVILAFLEYCVEKNATDYMQCLLDNKLLKQVEAVIEDHHYAVSEYGRNKVYIGDDGLPYPMPDYEKEFALITSKAASRAIN